MIAREPLDGGLRAHRLTVGTCRITGPCLARRHIAEHARLAADHRTGADGPVPTDADLPGEDAAVFQTDRSRDTRPAP